MLFWEYSVLIKYIFFSDLEFNQSIDLTCIGISILIFRLICKFAVCPNHANESLNVLTVPSQTSSLVQTTLKNDRDFHIHLCETARSIKFNNEIQITVKPVTKIATLFNFWPTFPSRILLHTKFFFSFCVQSCQPNSTLICNYIFNLIKLALAKLCGILPTKFHTTYLVQVLSDLKYNYKLFCVKLSLVLPYICSFILFVNVYLIRGIILQSWHDQ